MGLTNFIVSAVMTSPEFLPRSGRLGVLPASSSAGVPNGLAPERFGRSVDSTTTQPWALDSTTATTTVARCPESSVNTTTLSPKLTDGFIEVNRAKIPGDINGFKVLQNSKDLIGLITDIRVPKLDSDDLYVKAENVGWIRWIRNDGKGFQRFLILGTEVLNMPSSYKFDVPYYFKNGTLVIPGLGLNHFLDSCRGLPDIHLAPVKSFPYVFKSYNCSEFVTTVGIRYSSGGASYATNKQCGNPIFGDVRERSACFQYKTKNFERPCDFFFKEKSDGAVSNAMNVECVRTKKGKIDVQEYTVKFGPNCKPNIDTGSNKTLFFRDPNLTLTDYNFNTNLSKVTHSDGQVDLVLLSSSSTKEEGNVINLRKLEENIAGRVVVPDNQPPGLVFYAKDGQLIGRHLVDDAVKVFYQDREMTITDFYFEKGEEEDGVSDTNWKHIKIVGFKGTDPVEVRIQESELYSNVSDISIFDATLTNAPTAEPTLDPMDRSSTSISSSTVSEITKTSVTTPSGTRSSGTASLVTVPTTTTPTSISSSTVSEITKTSVTTPSGTRSSGTASLVTVPTTTTPQMKEAVVKKTTSLTPMIETASSATIPIGTGSLFINLTDASMNLSEATNKSTSDSVSEGTDYIWLAFAFPVLLVVSFFIAYLRTLPAQENRALEDRYRHDPVDDTQDTVV